MLPCLQTGYFHHCVVKDIFDNSGMFMFGFGGTPRLGVYNNFFVLLFLHFSSYTWSIKRYVYIKKIYLYNSPIHQGQGVSNKLFLDFQCALSISSTKCPKKIFDFVVWVWGIFLTMIQKIISPLVLWGEQVGAVTSQANKMNDGLFNIGTWI